MNGAAKTIAGGEKFSDKAAGPVVKCAFSSALHHRKA
jgi:hypothetical protein